MITNFTNANLGNNLNEKKSIEGLNFKFGSMLFTWNNKKQQSIALSLIEFKYKTQMGAIKKVVWLQKLLIKLGILGNNKVPVFWDNKSCIKIFNDINLGTKHFAISSKALKSWVRQINNLQVVKVFTNMLGKTKFFKCRNTMGLHCNFLHQPQSTTK